MRAKKGVTSVNIRKHGKLLIVIICTLILAAVIATAVVVRNAAVRKKDRKPVITIEEEKTEYYNGLPIGWVYADYDFSPYDYRNLVGDADYVFVGKVIENKGVIYENIQTVVGEGGVKYTFSDPFTVYSVEVEKNIKGELAERIEIEKDGGLAQSGERYTIIENDILPIMCCGESEEEFDAGKTEEKIRRQIRLGLAEI